MLSTYFYERFYIKYNDAHYKAQRVLQCNVKMKRQKNGTTFTFVAQQHYEYFEKNNMITSSFIFVFLILLHA